MEAIDPLLITTLNYYLREKYFGTALNICEEILRRKRDDSIMVLMKSYCLTKLGKSLKGPVHFWGVDAM